MATTAADKVRPWLPLVRRLEAAGFRAWPAANVSYDGSWQLRTTPGHPSKRLNCLVPLDPADGRDMASRIHSAEAAFASKGLRAAVRQSPLCPPGLPDILSKEGWLPKHRTLVMAADLEKLDYGHGMDHLPTHDIQRFAEACIRIDDGRDTTAPVLGGIIDAIEPPAGLFLMEDAAGPKAVGICVQDNDLAGLQQVVVEKGARRRGLGLELVSAALKWARLRGARQAWLQVIADNQPARLLYERMGFKAAYDYSYWQKES
jgi:GNAT superfamily N-acetyltransferase